MCDGCLCFQDEMRQWLGVLAEVTGTEITEFSTKSQTMPAQSSSKKEDSAKKKGKFTMKKK